MAAPSLWQALRALRAAHRAHYISSKEMRRGVVHKILSDIAVVLSAAVLDFMLVHVQSPGFATGLVMGYLAMTEFVSIMENLQDSGVVEAGAFAALVSRRGGMLKDVDAAAGVPKDAGAADGGGDGGRTMSGVSDERKVR